MNKKSFLILVLCLVFFSLTACGKKHKHEYGDWSITKEATCLEVGVKQRSCLCGEKEIDFINKLPHTEVLDEVVLATCLTDGLSAGKHCSVCNTVLEAQSNISALGHSYNEKWEYINEETCGRLCLRCGEYEACSHVSSGQATEDKSEFCLVCGYIISPALSHSVHTKTNNFGYNSTHHWYKCEGCEAQRYDFVEHNLSAYEIVTDATTTSEGVMKAVCQDGCGYVSIKKILKTPVVIKVDDYTISWDMVDNADGYYLYDGNQLVSDLGNVLEYSTKIKDTIFKYCIVAYTNESSYHETSNFSNIIKLAFEADIENLQANYGTNFEGFNSTDHADLYQPVGGITTSGWKIDGNGVKAYAVQGNYQGVSLALDPEDNTNTVLRVQGTKEVTRVALNVNQDIVNIGTYKFSIKVKLGTQQSTSIGKILLRINKYNDISASGALSDSIFFSESDDTDSILSANQWTTLETVYTITDEIYEELSLQDVCLAFIVYTNNDTNGLGSSVNHILIDDLEIYKVNPMDPEHTHNYVWNEFKETTCKEIGLKAHNYCEGCGKYFDENKNQIVYKTLVIDKLRHTYGEYTVVKPATTTEEGIIEFSCLTGCGEVISVKSLKTPTVSYSSPYLIWDEVSNAEGYKLYNNGEFVCDLGNVLEYQMPLLDKCSLYQIEAYTSNEEYFSISSKSEVAKVEVVLGKNNLQESTGTDFEGYNTTDHADLFDSSSSFTGTSSGLWQADSNGNNVFGFQKDYNDIRLVEENDGNIALKVAGKGNGSLNRVGLDISDEVKTPGTYTAKIKVKAGPEANNIGSILFRLYDTDSLVNDNYVYKDGFYFRNKADNPEALSKDEWTTLEVKFTITKDGFNSKYNASKNLVIVLIAYTNNKANNANNYLLVDDFEIYQANIVDQNHEHDYAWNQLVEATCENEGLKAYYYCEVCENYFDENKENVTYESLIIEKSSHDYQWNEVVKATCVNPGLDEHYYCKLCEKYFDKDKNETSFDSLIIDMINHSYDSKEIIEEATTTKEGSIKFTCISGCGETIISKVLITPTVSYTSPYLMWNEVPNADGYKLYSNGKFVCDLGNSLSYIVLNDGTYSYQIEAYTNNDEYYNLSNKSEVVDGVVVNLQSGFGTDFEGYSPETHNMYFDPNSSLSASSSGTWVEDNNGLNAYAYQSGYKVRLVEEADGNVALRIGGYTFKKSFRVGLNLTGEVSEPGTYVAKIKAKRGPEATISKFFFKINKQGITDSNHPLQYINGGSSSSVTGFYFNDTEATGTELDFEFDTEWKEYYTTFTIEEGSAVDKANTSSFCAAFVMYTSNVEANAEKDYLLVDDFEIFKIDTVIDDHQHNYVYKEAVEVTDQTNGLKAHYYCDECSKYFDENKNEVNYNNLIIFAASSNLQASYGTDFNCFTKDTHSKYFLTEVGKAFSTAPGWIKYNDTRVVSVPAANKGCCFDLDPDNSNNTVFRALASANTTRVPLYPNQSIKNVGTYLAKIKVRLGTVNATNIEEIYFEFNKISSYNSDGKLPIDQVYFSDSDDTDSILSASEWTTLEVVFTITEDMSLILDNEGNAISIVLNVTTNNKSLGLNHKENYVLIDDFEIYKVE